MSEVRLQPHPHMPPRPALVHSTAALASRYGFVRQYTGQMNFETSLLADLGLKKSHNLGARPLLRHLGATQDGQFSTRQASVLGVRHSQVLALRDTGEIQNQRYGVWRFVSATGSADPAITAFLACWPAGVISHDTTAVFYGLRRVARPEKPHITVLDGVTCRPTGVVVHHTTSLPGADILKSGPLRYTSLARNVCDLANPRNQWETLAILDDAVALGAKPRWIHERALALSLGRGGVDTVAKATAPGASSEFRSWLERAACDVFAAGGLPAAEWNVPLHDSAGLIGVVDALWRPYQVVSELQGLRFHTTPRQLERDNRKRNRLGDAHHQLRVSSWTDLVHDPVDVVATLMRALRAAGADLDLARIPRDIAVPAHPFQ